jgi:hypothetical protein
VLFLCRGGATVASAEQQVVRPCGSATESCLRSFACTPKKQSTHRHIKYITAVAGFDAQIFEQVTEILRPLMQRLQRLGRLCGAASAGHRSWLQGGQGSKA